MAQRTTTNADELTKGQIRRYVAGGGVSCPFCKAEAIEGGSISIESGAAYQDVDCSNCNKSWTDSYKLAGVV